ncbi:MAG: hypothetical protein ACLSHL_09190 [Alistipes communis]
MSTENAWSAYGNDACRCINSNLYNSIDLRDFRRHSWLDPDRKDPEKESYDYKSCRKEGKEYFNELPDYANIKFRPAQGAYEDFKVGGASDHPTCASRRCTSSRPRPRRMKILAKNSATQ